MEEDRLSGLEDWAGGGGLHQDVLVFGSKGATGPCPVLRGFLRASAAGLQQIAALLLTLFLLADITAAPGGLFESQIASKIVFVWTLLLIYLND